jgi:drug/metabolite transporter (DMT)-like permease
MAGKTGAKTAEKPFEPLDYGLYGLTVLSWSASWIAIALQVGVVANEVNLVWRFSIAAVVMFAWALFSGRSLRFGARDHLRFAALGVLIFSSNFLLFYYGALFLVSGLLSVVFSLASVINMVLGALVLGERPSQRVMAGGAAGFVGVGLMFWPEMARSDFSGGTLIGLLLCLGGTLCFCLGNLVSARAQGRGLPLVPMNAWGMFYGTAWSGLLALFLGREFVILPTVSYLGSLVFLAVISTVVAFAAYLTLLGRIGGARAGYATVIFPVVALMISTVAEGYVWTAPAIVGLALVAAGNVLVIRSGRKGPRAAPQEPERAA